MANSDLDTYFSLKATAQILFSSQLKTDYHIVSYDFYIFSKIPLYSKAEAWWGFISWTHVWNWDSAIGKAAGEERKSKPESRSLYLWKHSECNWCNNSLIQMALLVTSRTSLMDEFLFSFSNGGQLLTKSQRKQNKILP